MRPLTAILLLASFALPGRPASAASLTPAAPPVARDSHAAAPTPAPAPTAAAPAPAPRIFAPPGGYS